MRAEESLQPLRCEKRLRRLQSLCREEKELGPTDLSTTPTPPRQTGAAGFFLVDARAVNRLLLVPRARREKPNLAAWALFRQNTLSRTYKFVRSCPEFESYQ